MEKIKLLPGVLNDANRDYLPQAIKGSTMVVNENGNNSHVYPKNLKEYTGDLLGDGIQDTWYVYVPDSYEPSKKTPLVFSMHGGLMSGWGQCIYTSWSLVADKEGFLCVFPNASSMKMWMIECDPATVDEICSPAYEGAPALNRPVDRVPEFHDVKLVMALLEKMQQDYNIDPGRVYIQGMSMGNAMTSQVVRYLGKRFAAAAGSGCPTNCKLLFTPEGTLINEGGPLDVWSSRLEHDQTPPHYGEGDRSVITGNLNYWRRLNDAMGLPELSIRGDKNFLYYRGSKANVMFMDVYNRDHGQTFDDAQLVWDYLFSGVYRDDAGVLQHTAPNRSFHKDTHNLLLSEGAGLALANGNLVEIGGTVFCRDKLKYHGLDGEQIVRGSYLYVPVAFLTKHFGGILLSDGDTAKIRLADGRELTFAHGCIGCTVDNTITDMLCEAVTVDGRLCVSAQWFCETLFNLHVSCYGDCLYACDHVSHLSRYTAWLLSDILHGVEDRQRGLKF